MFTLSGCSSVSQYLDYWKKERALRKEFHIEPTNKLLRDLQPGDSFKLVGQVIQKTEYEGPALVVAVIDMFKQWEIVVERILQTPVRCYQVYLPQGNNDFIFFWL